MEEKIIGGEDGTESRHRGTGASFMDVEVSKVTRLKIEKTMSLLLKSSIKGGRRMDITLWRGLNEVFCEKYPGIWHSDVVEGAVLY